MANTASGTMTSDHTQKVRWGAFAAAAGVIGKNEMVVLKHGRQRTRPTI